MNAAVDLDMPGLSAVGDVAEMGTTIGKLGIHSYQKHKLNGVDEAGQTAGVDEADQKYMRIAHSGYGNTLDQEIRLRAVSFSPWLFLRRLDCISRIALRIPHSSA